MFKGGLTQRVQRLLSAGAQNEARRFNSDQLLPAHIIIARLREGAGTACKALMFMRIDLAGFLRTLESTIPRIPGILIHGDVPPAKRTKSMLEAAAAEAREMDSDFLGTEHLLFAAMREQNSSVQTYLEQWAIDTDMLKVVVQTTFDRPARPGGDRRQETDEEADHSRVTPRGEAGGTQGLPGRGGRPFQTSSRRLFAAWN